MSSQNSNIRLSTSSRYLTPFICFWCRIIHVACYDYVEVGGSVCMDDVCTLKGPQKSESQLPADIPSPLNRIDF